MDYLPGRNNKVALTSGWNGLRSESSYDAVLEMDLTTGIVTTITDSETVGSGMYFYYVDSVIEHPLNSELLIVSDQILDTIFTVDLTNGHRASLSGMGPHIVCPIGFAPFGEPEAGVVLLVDCLADVLAMDAVTGERVYYSR